MDIGPVLCVLSTLKLQSADRSNPLSLLQAYCGRDRHAGPINDVQLQGTVIADIFPFLYTVKYRYTLRSCCVCPFGHSDCFLFIV